MLFCFQPQLLHQGVPRRDPRADASTYKYIAPGYGHAPGAAERRSCWFSLGVSKGGQGRGGKRGLLHVTNPPDADVRFPLCNCTTGLTKLCMTDGRIVGCSKGAMEGERGGTARRGSGCSRLVSNRGGEGKKGKKGIPSALTTVEGLSETLKGWEVDKRGLPQH